MKSPLEEIPGVGKRTAAVMEALGIRQVRDLAGQDPEAEREYENLARFTVSASEDVVTMKILEDLPSFMGVDLGEFLTFSISVPAETAEALAQGQPVSAELADRFAQAVKEDINPRDSWRAAKDFRLHIAVESAKRAFIESVKLAGGDL